MKSTNTLPERLLAGALDDLGVVYERHVAGLPGTPDIVLTSDRVAVFVHGCYWHRHYACTRARVPARDTAGWLDRFASTVARDQQVAAALRACAWWPHVAWECDILADHSAEADAVMKTVSSWRVWHQHMS